MNSESRSLSPQGDDAGEQENTYRELHRIARAHMRRSSSPVTLQPTLLVHEAWLRLTGRACRSHTHFLALASRAMRHFVLDYVRARSAQKRAGGEIRVPFEEESLAGPAAGLLIDADPTLEIERFVERLDREAPRKAHVVRLHLYRGLELPEIARELRVSVMTVRRDWQFCRAWLCCALRGGAGEQA